MKISEQVERLEKENEFFKGKLENARAKGKDDALRFLNSKTIGFLDGAAKILQDAGMDAGKSYEIADQIWDLAKRLTER